MFIQPKVAVKSNMSMVNLQSPEFCVRRLKVLADTTRFQILKILMKKPSHVGEMNTVLKIEQSLLSHHLKVLREEGFVQANRDGKAVLYCLAPGIRLSPQDGIDLGCCQLSFPLQRED